MERWWVFGLIMVSVVVAGCSTDTTGLEERVAALEKRLEAGVVVGKVTEARPSAQVGWVPVGREGVRAEGDEGIVVSRCDDGLGVSWPPRMHTRASK